MNNIDPVRFGLAGGVLSGAGLFLMVLLSIATGYGQDYLNILAGVFPGFEVTLGGSLLGLLYGFIEGFSMLFLLAWLYNMFGPKSQA